MRIAFVYGNYDDEAWFDVEREPTDEEVKAIYDDIYNKMDEIVEMVGDLDGLDFWMLCEEVVKKYLRLVNNPVVKTFYIDRVGD